MHINKSRLISIILSPLYLLIDWGIKQKSQNKKNKKILLIFLGYIGDYILFRNFIEEIKKDSKYKNYKITLCGNPLWKSISENLDKKYVNSFIWINRKKFLVNPIYRFRTLKKISKKSFETAIMPDYGRSFSVDSIFNISNSINKIGNNGGLDSILPWQKKISDQYYTKLIYLKKEFEFEFTKNKDFFEQFLNKKLSTNLSIPIKKLKIDKSYIIFIPGAGADFKKWSPKNFVKVADFIISKNKVKIKILGSKKDSELAEKIITNSKYPKEIENLTGNNLLDTTNLIGNSKLVISNDTGPSHIAAATNIPTLCLTNGNEFGRFYPYPKNMSKKIIHLFPPKLEDRTFEGLVKEYSKGSNLNINSITSEKLIKKIQQLDFITFNL
ncbi:MAG: glycosyltransferase family 9 protein [Nanoarchaeota archaeon]|nr:glycosyltransferase family 9 protein [Nanoarchaeota archaeon]